MTYNEIVKSLEICANDGNCEECKINPHRGNYGYCTSLAIKAALDLINRQKAEIERLHAVHADMTESLRLAAEANKDLQAEIDRLEKQNKALHKRYLNKSTAYNELLDELQETRAEAIKEFAERLKSDVTYHEDECGEFVPWVDCRDIDDLVKEMTEGNSNGG